MMGHDCKRDVPECLGSTVKDKYILKTKMAALTIQYKPVSRLISFRRFS